MKIKILTVLLFLFFTTEPFTQSRQEERNIFIPGETLVYSVSWTLIRIGTITIKTSSYPDNPHLIKVSMMVESNPAIFFVSVKEYNETIINVKTCMSERFYGCHKDGESNLIINSAYDSMNKMGVYSVYNDHMPADIKTDTVYNCGPYVDGPSLFFLTRVLSGSAGAYNVPTMIDGKIYNTRLEFKNERDEIDVEAYPNSVPAKKFYGNAEWNGGTAQGLSGEFTGWVSDDPSAIILSGKVDILLGSVNIELEKITKSCFVQFVKTSQKN